MKKWGMGILLMMLFSFFAAAACLAGGINGALEGADKEMQAVQEKFERSIEEKKSGENNDLITMEGDEPIINESGVVEEEKAAENQAGSSEDIVK